MLSTEQNSGIPFGIRRRRKTDDIARILFAGTTARDAMPAAGVAHVTPASWALFMRYAPGHPLAGTWAFPGGGMEGDEEPHEAARRETIEETGFDPGDKLTLLNRNADHGADYSTFKLNVEHPFRPQLSAEHDRWTWAPLADPPSPLHPGVKHLLTAGYMPSDKIAATDSALALALDRDSVREPDRDGRMRVKIANISKACVNPYRGHEIPDWERLGLDPNRIYNLLRDPEELQKGAQSFNGVQILRKHVPVSAEDHQPWDVVGSTGTDAKFEEPYLTNSLSIWARDAIDGIESGAAKELSSGYHYRADMTPGNFRGSPYDGIMRDIVGNHVALVKDGRAGSDVVIGDSNEEIAMKDRELAQKLNALAARQISIGALVTYLRPRLNPKIAMDSDGLKIDFGNVFNGITGANFKTQKPEIAKRLREQAKSKLAKDASLDDVEKVLDMLDSHEIEAGDESVSEAQHNAMAAAAHGNSTLDIPQSVGKEFVRADKQAKDIDTDAVRAFLSQRGLSEEDVTAILGMLSGAGAGDEDADEKQRRIEEEAKRAAGKDAEMDKDKDDKVAKDKVAKDNVTKPAMDAAIKAATEATAKQVRETERGIRSALADVRPWVGELPATLAFDSADDVYRHAAVALNIPEAKTIHPSALPVVIRMQPKPGAREQQRSSANPSLGMDSNSTEKLHKRFPGIERIGLG